MHEISIVGSGLSGMVAACYLRQAGYPVVVYEKNDAPGGRARQFCDEGFVFDMGPSWYWMPDVFEEFFRDFGREVSDYYKLRRLDPSYSVYFSDRMVDVPAGVERLEELFEEMEGGSGLRLREYLRDAGEKYAIGMHRYAGKPALKVREFISRDVLSLVRKLNPLRNMESHVNGYFDDPDIRKIMQFPVIFLGAMPDRIPSMYSLMNYADASLGTWYPEGGMYEVVKAVYRLACELGVVFRFNSDVERIGVKDGRVHSLYFGDREVRTDALIGAGDYHHMEQLLPAEARQYSPGYWAGRELAPSCLLYFVGVNRKLPLQHHSMFFDSPFEEHARCLYEEPGWPSEPLFYVCAPSVTDSTVSPEGCENLFILIPVASGLEGETEALRERYFGLVMERLEKRLGVNVREHVIYKRSYGLKDFKADYHALRGNAYGLANTLRQTAFGKPRLRSNKVRNLFFCGQLTVPGPGLPPAVLSGRMAAREMQKYLRRRANDVE